MTFRLWEKIFSGFSDFIIQALLQHTIAYISHFGIDAFAQLMSNISGQAGFVHSEYTRFRQYPERGIFI